jgi:hypothetical protein
MQMPEPQAGRGRPRDRRRAPRLDSETMTFCRLLRVGAPALSAGVLDVSLTGAGLLLSGPPDITGAVVLSFRRRGAQPPLEVRARVVYVAVQPGGTALLGCEFVTPLADEQLLAIRS